MRFFDTHAHLNDESFDTDRAALIEGLPSCGAELILDVACAAEDFEKTLEITAKYPFIYGAAYTRTMRQIPAKTGRHGSGAPLATKRPYASAK